MSHWIKGYLTWLDLTYAILMRIYFHCLIVLVKLLQHQCCCRHIFLLFLLFWFICDTRAYHALINLRRTSSRLAVKTTEDWTTRQTLQELYDMRLESHYRVLPPSLTPNTVTLVEANCCATVRGILIGLAECTNIANQTDNVCCNSAKAVSLVYSILLNTV